MRLLETKLENWNQIFELDKFFLSPFVFRGQSNSDWSLKTSIERAISNLSKNNFDLGFGYEIEEKWMLHEFKKKYPLYSSLLPKKVDNFEWLSIMQHYGAPTRLLDFTKSIFIAYYFAVIDSTTDSAIWCINSHQLRDLLHDRFRLSYEHGVQLMDEVNDIHISLANKFIANMDYPIEDCEDSIIPLEPNMFTERLSKQQGLFLMPINSKISFYDNLIKAFNLKSGDLQKIDFTDLVAFSVAEKAKRNVDLIKIIIPKEKQWDIHRSLKEMNLTAEILFPGIDGLAKSLIQSHIQT